MYLYWAILSAVELRLCTAPVGCLIPDFLRITAESWNDVKRAHDRNAPWDAPCFQFVSSWNQSRGSRFVWEMSSPQFAWQQLLVTKQPWNMFWHIELQLPSKASRVNCHAALLQCRDFVSTLFREADFWIYVILWCRTTTRTLLGLCRILLYTQV